MRVKLYPSRTKEYTRNYARIWRQKNRHKLITFCKKCSKEIDKRSTYCNKCKMEFIIPKISGDNNHQRKLKPWEHYQWKGGKPRCIDCGKLLVAYHITRCNKCWLKYNRGKNHFNWQGGKSFEPYPLGWTRTFKEQIRYRDKYTCQSCGVPEVECNRRLCVHHKDLDKSNLRQNNLISLCLSCHIKLHWRIIKSVY